MYERRERALLRDVGVSAARSADKVIKFQDPTDLLNYFAVATEWEGVTGTCACAHGAVRDKPEAQSS